jgi:hypothetical protein
MAPGVILTTLYFISNLQMAQHARGFVPGWPFQPSVMFESKAVTYPSKVLLARVGS